MFKHKGYGLLLPTIACAALIGGVGLSVTKMSNVSVGAILSTKTKYVGQQYALNTADKYCRLHNYASLTGIEKRKIDGSDDYYEEVIVNNSTVPIVSGSTEVSTVAAKDITVNVYHKESDRMPLVSTIKLYRTDPATFEPGFNMVANDATSTNEYQAMSANAFRELLNSKISDDMTADTTDVAMSANASKLYINSVLKDYALADDTVSVESDAGAGSPFRGVYIDKNGVAKPIDVVVRGNKTADADPWVLLPHLNNGTWELNKIRMSELQKDNGQTSFEVTIKQTANQTITVTTDDGVKHTDSFTAAKGTKWTASVNASTGYNAGKLISTSGTITGATTVSATEATIQTFNFEIVQSEGQTITVTTDDGVKHTESFKASYGTKWSATVSAEDVAVAGTTVGQCLLNGEYNTEETYNLQIPDDVTQIAVRGHYGPHHVADLLQVYYINNIVYTVIETSSNNNQAEVLVTPGSNITIKARATLETKPNNDYDYLDSWGVYVLKTSNTSSSSSSSSTSTTAGNLIVNGVDTGSTTGSGTVTGIVSVSATSAKTAESETKDLHKWIYQEDDNINTFESIDDDYYCSFTTCPNVKYIYIRGGANLEDADDSGEGCFYLKNETNKELKIEGIGQYMSALASMAIIKVSPNTQYKILFDAEADVLGIYDLGFYVQEVDESTLTIDETKNEAYSDSLQNLGVVTFRYIPYYDFTN